MLTADTAPPAPEAAKTSSRAAARTGPRGPARARVRTRLTREERSPDARAAIFAAAAEVVGKHGYADASINRITEVAGIAQGTFYLYFSSRQALFDELLPHVGKDMLHFVGKRVAGVTDVLEMEEKGFRAFFAYLERNPGFFRILNEAEIAAPLAYETHFKRSADHYIEALERGIAAGQIRRFERDELDTIAYVLMAARSYLYLRFLKSGAKGKAGRARLPEKVIQTYLKLVRDGLK